MNKTPINTVITHGTTPQGGGKSVASTTKERRQTPVRDFGKLNRVGYKGGLD